MSVLEDEDPYAGFDSDVDKDYCPSETSNSSDDYVLTRYQNRKSSRDQGESSSKPSVSGIVLPARNLQQNEGELITPVIVSNKTRKRKRDPSEWAQNVRKHKRNSGEAYISSRKKLVPAKEVKTFKDCATACRKKCGEKITDEERQRIFEAYYQLTKEEKKLFLLANTQKCTPLRRRLGKSDINSKKKFSFKFYFHVNVSKVEVCKSFFLGTLSVSQKTIYSAHASKNEVGNTPKRSVHGKHIKKRIPEDMKQSVRDHINSIPRIDSHYCRATSERQYMESSLSIAKLYEDYMKEKGEVPVKSSQYRYIFCTEFNIFFQTPKKDRCDVCELVKLHREEQREIDDQAQQDYEKHVAEKNLCRTERNHDREDKEKMILCFDLENVLTCPKADVNKFFYKSKLSVYNLTAHLSSTKQVYCSVWSEHLMERKGNDIASALSKILSKVLADHPHLTELTLWSDSCVAQNRNSMLSFAITKFLWENKNQLGTITIKYSVPGHSCFQEVDATHSAIERVLEKTEYYSPLSLIRILLKVNMKKPYRIHQMQLNDFLDFQALSSSLNYDNVPFSKVSVLQFSKATPHIVKFKTSYGQENFTEVEIGSLPLVKVLLQKVTKPAKAPGPLPKNKIDALQFMLKWMPLIDQQFYRAILPKEKPTYKGKKKITMK